ARAKRRRSSACESMARVPEHGACHGRDRRGGRWPRAISCERFARAAAHPAPTPAPPTGFRVRSAMSESDARDWRGGTTNSARPARARPALSRPGAVEHVVEPGPSGTEGDHAMKRAKYEKELHKLQVRLCHLQNWVKEKQLRVVIVFEGRD